MKVPARLLMMAKMCSTADDLYRPIDCVRFESEGEKSYAIATEQRAMIVAEFPTETDKPLESPMLIHRDVLDAVLLAALKSAGKKAFNEWLRYGTISIELDSDGIISGVLCGLPDRNYLSGDDRFSTSMAIGRKPTNGIFPPWREVMKNAADVTPNPIEINIDCMILSTMFETVGAMIDDGNSWHMGQLVRPGGTKWLQLVAECGPYKFTAIQMEMPK